MYEVVRGCEELLLTGLAERRPGRRRAGQPDTMQEAQERIERLEKEKKQLSIERDKLYCRGELMQSGVQGTVYRINVSWIFLLCSCVNCPRYCLA